MQFVEVALDYLIVIEPGATKNFTLKWNSQGKFPREQGKVCTSEEPLRNLLPTSTRAFSSPDRAARRTEVRGEEEEADGTCVRAHGPR